MLSLDAFIQKNAVLILDGAMATELEKRGADLNHALWSAKLLIENPNLIKQVHRDYILAGANIITSASYQASFEGFAQQGMSEQTAIRLMQLSISLALEARDEAMAANPAIKIAPLVAASIGPYGASLANGSEYTGNYEVGINELIEFHSKRFAVFAETGADLLACETIPSIEEALALIAALKAYPTLKAWISFSCKDDSHVCSGSSFEACVAIANSSPQVIAVGVNCTDPKFIESLVTIARQHTEKHIVVYPNKGETWDALHKCWIPGGAHTNFVDAAKKWYQAGARLIGGCCQTSPDDILQLSKALKVSH